MERAHHGMQRHTGFVRKQKGETKDSPGQSLCKNGRIEEMAYNLIISIT